MLQLMDKLNKIETKVEEANLEEDEEEYGSEEE